MSHSNFFYHYQRLRFVNHWLCYFKCPNMLSWYHPGSFGSMVFQRWTEMKVEYWDVVDCKEMDDGGFINRQFFSKLFQSFSKKDFPLMESELDLIYKSIIFETNIFGIFWCPLNVVKNRDFYDVLQGNIGCKIIINKLGRKPTRNEF